MSPTTDRTGLTDLGPVAQLYAGRLGRRLPQLLGGLVLYGLSMAMLIRADLGLDPWDVLHQGLTHYVPLSFGMVTIVVGALVLLLWIPLRQKPGLGTVSNVVVIGLAADVGLWLFSTPADLAGRTVLMVSAIVLNGMAGAIYIGSQLGPGPRDGLMTGLAARTGRSLRLVRVTIEVSVLAVGVLLGRHRRGRDGALRARHRSAGPVLPALLDRPAAGPRPGSLTRRRRRSRMGPCPPSKQPVVPATKCWSASGW